MAKPSKNPWQLTDDSEKRAVVSLVLLYGTGGMIDRWHKKFPDRHSGDSTKDKSDIREATKSVNPRNDQASQKWKDFFNEEKGRIDEQREADLERAVTRIITEFDADLDDIKHTEIESSLDLVHQQQAKTLIVDRIHAFLDRLRGHNDSDSAGHGDDSRSAKPTSFERVKSIFKVSRPETYDG